MKVKVNDRSVIKTGENVSKITPETAAISLFIIILSAITLQFVGLRLTQFLITCLLYRIKVFLSKVWDIRCDNRIYPSQLQEPQFQ